MERLCQATGSKFVVSEEELSLLDRLSPVIGLKKQAFPPPNYSPTERQRRRLAFRNLRSLYKRKCDLSGRAIISCYAPDSAHTVYHSEEWWSDKWDAFAYGRDFDFNRNFFEQFHELYQAVPTIHQYVILSENCEYVNGAANCRNCYLSFNMDYCEGCYYVTDATHCNYCLDCLGIDKCELCYQCIECENCYNLLYSERCLSCYDSYFLTECKRCKNCIACSNLIDKEYHLFNKPIS